MENEPVTFEIYTSTINISRFRDPVSDVVLPESNIKLPSVFWMFLRIRRDRYVRLRLSDVAVPMATRDKDVIDGDGGDPWPRGGQRHQRSDRDIITCDIAIVALSSSVPPDLISYTIYTYHTDTHL